MSPVKYTLESSVDQRCRQAMHSWSHTLYDQRFIGFYHLIVAKVFEVIVSYLNTLGKYLITNTNTSSFQTTNTITNTITQNLYLIAIKYKY